MQYTQPVHIYCNFFGRQYSSLLSIVVSLCVWFAILSSHSGNAKSLNWMLMLVPLHCNRVFPQDSGCSFRRFLTKVKIIPEKLKTMDVKLMHHLTFEEIWWHMRSALFRVHLRWVKLFFEFYRYFAENSTNFGSIKWWNCVVATTF